MSEQAQHNDSLPPASAEQDVAASIKKIQQQLVFLEEKIDILISQSQAKPFSEKHFPKPFRSFGYPDRRSDRETDNASGGKSFDRGRHFEKSHGEENRGFGHKKRAYDNSRESDFSQEHHFEKRHGGGKRGFNQKKKASKKGGDNMAFQGGYDKRPREMHKAVCSDCKKECEVPFKPSGDRPIYCKDCFSKRKKEGR